MDFGWRFHLGEAPDAGMKFAYPEVHDLDKTQVKQIGQEGILAAAQPDPVAANLGGDVSFVQPAFDDSSWRILDLPHDWADELPFDQTADGNHGYKPVGPGFDHNNVGWYRRVFTLTPADKSKALYLEFDGIYRNSLVWLNGHCLGREVSGYTGFYRDIGKYANFDGKNTLVVRVDASRFEGWFYEGAGIYRHIWLIKTAPLHIANNGVFVYSQFPNNVPEGAADIHMQVDLVNADSLSVDATASFGILDPSGQAVARAEQSGNVSSASPATLQAVASVASPRLWSPESPKLYTLVTTIKNGDRVVDQIKTPFGIRTLAFDANKGFLLNGQPYFIKGVCIHQDQGGVGIAVPDRLHYFRISQLKEMGANGYRTAHNPPSSELLDACDQLGMLVLDENRRMDTSPQNLDDLRWMIRRDRNHPSIFAWSSGNEEVGMQTTPEGGAVEKAMTDIVHMLDPSRSVTNAMNFGWGIGFTDYLDVLGLNYTRNGDPDDFHWEYPAKPMLNTETGSSLTTRGVYDGSRGRGYHAAYDQEGTHSNLLVDGVKKNLTGEEWWNYYVVRPYLSSVFIWTGWDYRGEDHWPATSGSFGALDLCGFPKDIFYYYQSVWSGKPMLHLTPSHWNFTAGKTLKVVANSNCEEVELFLNDVSLGKQTMPKYGHLEWQVPYAPGTLSAKGYVREQPTIETKLETTGVPVAIQLIPDRQGIHGDGKDISIVTVETVDDLGRVVPTAANLIQFHVEGGVLRGLGNGDPCTKEIDNTDSRTLFNGLAQALIQAPRQSGQITLTADSPGLKSASVTIEADRSGPAPLVP